MSHDDFESERFRVERVLDIVEHAADRLDARAYVPVSLLRDAVDFIRASEDAAYDAAQMSAGEPTLSSCVDQHVAAREPLRGMDAALGAMERGEAAADLHFVLAAREYVRLRRDHMREDDRLFASTARPAAHREAPTGIEAVETAGTRHLYDRLVEESAMLEIAAPAALAGLNRKPRGAK
jgi:hemerythrin-like domain-containing protein